MNISSFFRIWCLSCLLFPLFASAQSGAVISGTIRDESSGEALIGVSVLVKDLSGVGAITNAYGFFSLTVPPGPHTFHLSFIGYASRDTAITVGPGTKTMFTLLPEAFSTEEVSIEARAEEDDNVTSPRMGITKLEMGEIARIPVLFGEKDILKTIQLLPGVKSAGEGNAGFYVRGGGADQNLVLLDEAPVYNPSHLLGFFSVFNSDALKDVTLIKGGMPAEYGGRLSSVMDVRMKEGNSKRLSISGGIGLISSRVTVEGPLKKDRGSFMVSGRRTYADVFLKLQPDTTLSQSSLYFYDVNAKANYRLGEKDQVFVSGYFGRDKFGFSDQFSFDWGNTTATARWNHLFSSRLFSNTTFIYSNYNYRIKIGAGGTNLNITSGIEDFNFKEDFQFYANNRHTIKFGVNAIRHAFVPGAITTDEDTTELPRQYALETAAYLSDEWSVSDRFRVSYGLRLSTFHAMGNDEYVYTYTAAGDVQDSTLYNRGEVYKSYAGLEPRLNLTYQLGSSSSLKASYMRTYQYMHLLSNATSSTPTDLWIPSSGNVQPERADQLSIGYFRNFDNNGYEFSAETYYKALDNQIDYRNGAQLTFNSRVEGELLYGKGRAYGLELFLKKKYGRLNGWISYTLSRTERQFEGINNGAWYAAKQDRTHDVSVVAIFDATKRLSLSATFVYYTGNAITFPSGKYLIEGQTVSLYTERNGYRMPAYHRLDLGATIQGKKHARFEDNWNFSLYNAYGRRNAYSITFQESETNPNATEAVRTTLFRWIPSVTYNFKF